MRGIIIGFTGCSIILIIIVSITLYFLYNKNTIRIERLKIRDRMMKNTLPKLNLPIKTRGIVPKKIYRLWCTKEANKVCGGRKVTERPYKITKKNEPDWEEIIYTNEEQSDFVETQFTDEPRIWQAYQLINPEYKAARADLVRLLLIYKYGGLYMDMKSCVVGKIPDIPSDKDMYCSHWDTRFFGMEKPHTDIFGKNGEIQNWYIYARQGAPILVDIISQVVNNILMSHYNYGYSTSYVMDSKTKVLYITGPIALTIAINSSPHKSSVYINSAINNSIKYMCEIGTNTNEKKGHYSKLTDPIVKLYEPDAYLINLERVPERLKSSKNELDKAKISFNVWKATDAKSEDFKKYYSYLSKNSYTNLKPGEIACAISHRSLWEHIYDTGVPYAIIFEDDISIPEHIDNKTIQKYIHNKPYFDLLYLGHCFPEITHKGKLVSEGCADCRHAYVISRNAIKILLEEPITEEPIDNVMKNLCKSGKLKSFLANTTHGKKTVCNCKGLIFQKNDTIKSEIKV